ncbi:glycosyl hydrolase, family 76 [Phlyctochytrium arcticum]|nr:glycosyl hydrolase, family 76 [Phlyctochytrium arcticum]
MRVLELTLALLIAPIGALAVCGKLCDGADAAQAGSDRVAASTTLYGRSFKLHVDDVNGMAWGTVEAGKSRDEMWLDRTWSGGVNTDGGGSLSKTGVPDGAGNARTAMFNVDDNSQRRIGALRLCGKAGDRSEIVCTGYARSKEQGEKINQSANLALMSFYNPATGLFPSTGWWNSANALLSVINNMRITGNKKFSYVMATTYNAQTRVSFETTYDMTKEQKYLATARTISDFMATFWDNKCGGGVWWDEKRTQKNAIANGLYLELNAMLAQRVTGTSVYLDRAKATWKWYSGTGMITGANVVMDKLDIQTCRPIDAVWTYNQGVIIGGLVELHKATNDSALLTRAQQIAAGSTKFPGLHAADGTTRDICEDNQCEPDGTSFKGPFMRGLQKLNDVMPDRPYAAYLQKQAQTAYRNRTPFDMYGQSWNLPTSKVDAARQASAVDLMNAAGV